MRQSSIEIESGVDTIPRQTYYEEPKFWEVDYKTSEMKRLLKSGRYYGVQSILELRRQKSSRNVIRKQPSRAKLSRGNTYSVNNLVQKLSPSHKLKAEIGKLRAVVQ